MLKVLQRAIAEEGGDPAELQRIREAREVLGKYRRLREKLGLAAVDDKPEKREAKIDKTGR